MDPVRSKRLGGVTLLSTLLVSTSGCAAGAGRMPADEAPFERQKGSAPARAPGPELHEAAMTPLAERESQEREGRDDPYRFLEAPSERTREWERDQAERTRAALHGDARFAELLARVKAYRDHQTRVRQVELRGSVAFSVETTDGGNAMAVVRRDGDKPPRVLFHSQRDGGSSRLRIDFFAVSPSGKHIALGTSEAGAEETTVRVLDAVTGRDGGDRVLDVRLGQLVWLPDESGFLYMRGRGRKDVPPADQLRDLNVARHRLGDPFEKDAEVVGSRAAGPRIHEEFEYCYPSLSEDGATVLVAVRRGVNPDLRVFAKPRKALLDGAVPWHRVYGEADGVRAFLGAAGHGLAIRADGPNGAVVEEAPFGGVGTRRVRFRSERPLEDLALVGDTLFVVQTDREIKRLLAVGRDGSVKPIEVPARASVRPESLRVDDGTHRLVFELRSWTELPTWWTVSPRALVAKDVGLKAASPGASPAVMSPAGASPAGASPAVVSPAGAFEVRSIEAPARDGESIPLTIVSPKRAVGAGEPSLVWVTAYGAYGTSLAPAFSVAKRVFLDLGGTLVMAHVRGGGEKGRAWHEAARGPTKTRTIHDTIDALRFLRAAGYGTGGGMLLSGTSAGGIAAGGVLVREPSLVDAVFIDSGTVHVSRSEALAAIGKIHKDEFGSNDTPEGARSLRELDVFENVRAGTRYPAVLLHAGRNDARVPYWQSSKLAARLQASTAGDAPVYLRLSGGGHMTGNTADEDADIDAEILTFALSRLGRKEAR